MGRRYWSVIRANVAEEGRDREDALVRWWADEHQPEYVAMDGFHLAWLARTVAHESAFGDPGQRYAAIYEIDGIDHFNAALAAGPPWGPWEEFVGKWVLDWTRTYYRLLDQRSVSDAAGAYWTIVKSDVDLDGPEDEARFHEWYRETHVPELLEHPGFHRAWRLELFPDPTDLGPRRHRFWAVYEVDSPAAFAGARASRAERGIEPWDGLWLSQLRDWGVSYHEVVNRVVAD